MSYVLDGVPLNMLVQRLSSWTPDTASPGVTFTKKVLDLIRNSANAFVKFQIFLADYFKKSNEQIITS